MMKKTRKFNLLPKWAKSRWFLFALAIVLTLLGSFFLLCIDKSNAYRPEWLNVPFFNETLPNLLGLQDYSDISMFSWFVFFIGFGILLIVSIFLVFFKYVKENKVKEYLEETGYEKFPKSESVKYSIKFALIVLTVVALYVVMLLMFFVFMKTNIFYYLSHAEDAKQELVKLLAAFGYLLVCLLTIPVAIIILVILLLISVRFIALIVGGVTESVVSSKTYQEAAANSAMVSDRIRQEVSQAMGIVQSTGYTSGSATIKALAPQDTIFPGLTLLDKKYKSKIVDDPEEEIDFNAYKNLALRFQAYLANKRDLYYKLSSIREFIAGLSASRMILLQGLSGTGKSTLPREFMEFIGMNARFFPVQSSWRDKTDVLGYYSDLIGIYKESEILLSLYEGSYTPKKLNMLVLDEMNIARPEYYFADFLSVFEYPMSDWLIKIHQPLPGQTLPSLLEGGYVRIPANTWFIGTLNVDDSTYTLSDKIYDRAIAIDFEENNGSFKVKYDDSLFPTTYNALNSFFAKAKTTSEYNLTKAEIEKFVTLTDYVAENFEVKFGNRIIVQIEKFVPVYTALGGTKIEALDHMFASKILRKLEYKYESYMDSALTQLEKFIDKAYGKGKLKQTEALIKRFKRRFN